MKKIFSICPNFIWIIFKNYTTKSSHSSLKKVKEIEVNFNDMQPNKSNDDIHNIITENWCRNYPKKDQE